MSRWLLVALAGCSASVDGRGGGTPDGASPDGRVDAVIADAAFDAVPCVGGDAAGVAPDGSCFTLFTTPASYLEARAACESGGAHLAILSTAALDTFAETFVGARDTFFGLTDLAAEGTFVWIDGAPLAFENWHDLEPNDGNNAYPEDCAIIAGARATKQWDDRPCAPSSQLPNAGKYAYLCQR